MVNALEPKGDARTAAWRGAAVLAALDATAAGGRDHWLARRQWDADAAAGGGGGAAPAWAAPSRHAKLFAYLKAQQGGA